MREEGTEETKKIIFMMDYVTDTTKAATQWGNSTKKVKKMTSSLKIISSTNFKI